MSIAISQRKEEDVVIITVEGKINVDTAPEFRRNLHEQMDNRENKIIINMQQLDYLSSAGIREFIVAYHQAKNMQGQIVLCGLRDVVRDVFKVTRLDSNFKIFDTEKKAFEHLNAVKQKEVLPEVNEIEIDDTEPDATEGDETEADVTEGDETEVDATEGDETKVDETEADETEKILKLTHKSENNTIIVFVEGKVNAVTASKFEKYLIARTDEGGKRLVIDMSNLIFLSCSGLRVLLQTANKINARNGDILLMGLKKTKNHVREVIEVAKFDVIIKTFVSEADALKELLITKEELSDKLRQEGSVAQFFARIAGKWKSWFKRRPPKPALSEDVIPDLKKDILDLEFRRKRDAVIVSVKGKVNTVTSPMFEKYLFDLIAKGETKLVIDLSKLDFLSSSGLRILLLTANKIKAIKGDMMLMGLDDARSKVRELLEVAKFHDTMVKTFASRADAYKELLATPAESLVKVIKPAKMKYLADLIKPVKFCAQKHGFGPDRINEIELALEEALVNIISYAYPDADAVGKVEICCWLNDQALFIIEIKDSGIPFDALKKDDPDLSGEIAEREVGGLGIYLIKQFMDDVKYRREQGHNILSFTVIKRDSTKPFYGR